MESPSNNKILLAHGGGGRLTHNLIEKTILPKFNNEILAQLADSADLELDSSNIFFTTDSYVVKPLFFNGGDIGKLSVCGTINDLAVAGARPVALSLALIITEGFDMNALEKILSSAAQAAQDAGVRIVTGDTKVVEAAAADGIFINTAGIGTKLPNTDISINRISPGDKIIINGNIGDHGMTIIAQREGIKFDTPLKSDCAALSDLTCKILECTNGVKFMRDPTRGGLAATLNEITSTANLDIELYEDKLPTSPSAKAAAEMLGFDLLDIANEGKIIIITADHSAETVLKTCKNHPLGKDAQIIGQVLEKDESGGIVELVTNIGGRRVVQMPYGRELPRIC